MRCERLVRARYHFELVVASRNDFLPSCRWLRGPYAVGSMNFVNRWSSWSIGTADFSIRGVMVTSDHESLMKVLSVENTSEILRTNIRLQFS